MKTQFKYIHFNEIPNPKKKTKYWTCINNKQDEELGWVCWYPGWRQYVFQPAWSAVFSAGCLVDIQSFIKEAMEDHKNGRKRISNSDH